MNKHTIIVIIASIVIVGPFGYSAWNIFAADQLEIRWTEGEKFDYFFVDILFSVFTFFHYV